MSKSKKAKQPKSDGPRPDLARVLEAKAKTLDENRPRAMQKRAKTGHQTARQNIAGLLDEGSFQEYGQLAKPAFGITDEPADGLVMGTGTVDGHRIAIGAYDYTVHAGTQSTINHAKSDRLFNVVKRLRLPLVWWGEGGGWRPHENNINPRMYEETFTMMAELSGLVPSISIVAGRCFAGNANLAALCDTVVATKKAALGIAGPPLVEAAFGLKLTPEELGPAELHEKAGAVDIVVEDEQEANQVVRQYLSYFRGQGKPGEAPDTMVLRDVIPENARRAYDVRKVITGFADVGSVLELRPKWGRAVVSSFVKVNGVPMGVLANQPMYLAGAMNSDACDKIARFIQLCDAYDIPLCYLCDTPGLFVGPDAEKAALVRHSARILNAAANSTTPFMTITLRKAYGLGYYMMGSLAVRPDYYCAWPTAEHGAMGFEGAVKITHKQELEAIEDPKERRDRERELADKLREHNTALEVAARYEYDDVIDPADTRTVIVRFLAALPPPTPRTRRKRTVDNW
jgi:acetyl-CoA carboxylase carboxyltransferase component